MIDEKHLRGRLKELAERAYTTGRYTYSDFLGLYETDILMRMKKELSYAGLELFGGADCCERRVARFGIGRYEENYPISIMTAHPVSQKFADGLTHRDILGALMNLGLERGVVGDIYIKENVAYFFCLSRVSPVIEAELTRAKRTTLVCRRTEELPKGVGGENYEEERVQIASERADVLVAAAFRLSREESVSLIRGARVFLDGRLCEDKDEIVRLGVIVTVRGLGRFSYLGFNSKSRKGKLNAKIGRWGAE